MKLEYKIQESGNDDENKTIIGLKFDTNIIETQVQEMKIRL